MFKLPATFSHAQASAAASLVPTIRQSGWQIDCAALQSFDSSALAFLLDMKRAANSDNASLVIHNPPPKLFQLATLYGVQDLITA
jgi:phospholipid transport system transporter-binding protein